MVVDLTRRQRSVCALSARGMSNKQVARRLGIGLRTVEAHRSEAYRKLGVHNGVQLLRVLWAAHK